MYTDNQIREMRECFAYRVETTKGYQYLVLAPDYKYLYESCDFWGVKAFASHYNLKIRCRFHRYSYAAGAYAAATNAGVTPPSQYRQLEAAAGCISTYRAN